MKLLFQFLFFLSISVTVFSPNNLSRALRDKVVLTQSPIVEKELEQKGLKLGNPIFIRIIKKASGYSYGVLELWVRGTAVDTFSLFKKYPICFYSGALGTKHSEGDGKSPEGFYFVNKNRLNQYSNYHRALNIGYPNAYERAKKYTGGYIMIHGSCCSIGCYAMTNKYIDEIWTLGVKALAGGQPFFRVHIFPFYMTQENMQKYSDDENIQFWRNLKQGFDYFQTYKYPPNVGVLRGEYTFR